MQKSVDVSRPMTADEAHAIAARYEEALHSFIGKLKDDPNIVAVVLEGSLAYDRVWQKSDMDVTVIIRDQAITTKSYCVDEDDIPINIYLTTRTEFRRLMEKSRGGGMTHSMFARAKLVYTKDDSLYGLLEDVKRLGDGDIERMFFEYSCWLIGDMEKIEKWLVVRDDVRYAQLYVLKAADVLANMYLILKGIAPNRESVLRVMEIDPDFIAPYYARPLSGAMSREEVLSALSGMRAFLEAHVDLLMNCALRHMEDGEEKTVTMLTKYFDIDSHGIYHVFDFLCALGEMDKVSQTIRITPKGRKQVEEVAFVYTKGLTGSQP